MNIEENKMRLLLRGGITIALMSCLSFGVSCSKEADNDSKKSSKKDVAGAKTPAIGEPSDSEIEEDLNRVSNGRIPDYPKLYCAHIGKLKLRHDVKQEISYFCNGVDPTDDMIAMRTQVMTYDKGYEVRKIGEKHDKEKETSDFYLAWGYYVKIRPFEVKARPLYDFISKSISNNGTKMTGTSARSPDDLLDHGLHLWSAEMNYDLSVSASSGLSLDSKRGTEYNMYQVESGNEEMGFGVESLREANPDYPRSVMINLSFNDGTGYNDGVGGTVVLNLLHITINNKGFPSTASKTVDEIGNFLASEMYKGLTE